MIKTDTKVKLDVKKSLTYTTLRVITIFICLTIIIATFLSYRKIADAIESQELKSLEKYVLERAQRERNIFTLTEQNQAVVKKDLVDMLKAMGDSDPVDKFNSLFRRYSDGVLRMHVPAKKGDKVTTAFIDESLEINADVRRRMIVFEKLAGKYGPVWNHIFPNIYIFSAADNMEAQYWPAEAQWDYSIGPDYVMADQEWAYISNVENNPERETVWTGLYWDDVSRIWMVSCVTPVDVDGRHVASVGQDIYLNQLVKRSIDDHPEGAYNIIFRKDGRLIAHPEKEQLSRGEEDFNIADSDNDELKQIYNAVLGRSDSSILELPEKGLYLAVARIDEPDWYFVIVYPRTLILKTAFESAMTVLMSGGITLFVVVLILFVIMRNKIGYPLRHFTEATIQIAGGETDVRLPVEREDEFGILARSFNLMLEKIEELIGGLKQRMYEKEIIEAEREKLLKRLESKNSELQSIVYVSSHDLRSPLVNIQGFSWELKKNCQELEELLQNKTPDANAKDRARHLLIDDIPEALEFITSSTTKMSELIDGLLQVSRLGTAEVKTQPVAMNELFKEIVKSMQFQLNENKVKLTVDDLPNCIGDPGYVNQLFSNLIDNAIKYKHPDRELEIDIISKTEDAMNLYIVSDNGVGIAPEYHKKIFEVFHQLDPENGPGGVGLGLTIVKRIIDKLDGKIELSSKEGVGSVFSIYLPKA